MILLQAASDDIDIELLLAFSVVIAVVVGYWYLFSVLGGIGRIKAISLGYKRLHLLVSILVGISTFTIGFFVYWLLVLAVFWVLDGFDKSNIQDSKP